MSVWQGLALWLLAAVVLIGLIARIGAGMRRMAGRRERDAGMAAESPVRPGMSCESGSQERGQ